tara:strand:- start:64 stop:603 length:540 start_codon:yes stop_codon:yes gene_type:complete
MGLVQRDTFTISSNVASVIIGGGSDGSSSYDFAINTDNSYMLVYHSLYMSNDGNHARIRITKSGSADSTGNYDNARMNMYSNQAYSDVANVNSDYMPNLANGTTLPESQMGIMYLHNFNSGSLYSQVNFYIACTTETPEYINSVGFFSHTVASASDGIQFYANANSIASGTFTLYEITV